VSGGLPLAIWNADDVDGPVSDERLVQRQGAFRMTMTRAPLFMLNNAPVSFRAQIKAAAESRDRQASFRNCGNTPQAHTCITATLDPFTHFRSAAFSL
jgi:hypothetical protein